MEPSITLLGCKQDPRGCNLNTPRSKIQLKPPNNTMNTASNTNSADDLATNSSGNNTLDIVD